MKKTLQKLIIFIAIFFCGTTFADQNKPQPLNSIAAVVNHDIITETQLNHAAAEMKQRWMSQNIPIPDEKTLRMQVLHQMILQKLQLQMAKQGQITVSKKEINQAIQTIAKQNQITVPVLLQHVQQSEHMNLAKFRAQLKKELLINKVQQMAVGGMIQISDKQVDEAYARACEKDSAGNVQYHVGDILIALPNNSTPAQTQAAHAQAQNILEKLNHGASFSEVARAVSTDNNAMSGGDLGWRKTEELPDIFVQPILRMKAGQSFGPIAAPNGLHIIKLEGVKKGKTNITKDQIHEQLFQQQFNDKLQNWLDQLQKGAYIKIFDAQ